MIRQMLVIDLQFLIMDNTLFVLTELLANSGKEDGDSRKIPLQSISIKTSSRKYQFNILPIHPKGVSQRNRRVHGPDVSNSSCQAYSSHLRERLFSSLRHQQIQPPPATPPASSARQRSCDSSLQHRWMSVSTEVIRGFLLEYQPVLGDSTQHTPANHPDWAP